MSNPINSGVGQWDKTSDLEWRIDQLVADMNIMWSKIADLESIRDENSEPYEAMESNKDAGEPVNQHYIDCLKQNVRLIEENDVLRYQYETMKNETVRCKEQIEKLQLENGDLRWRFDNLQLQNKKLVAMNAALLHSLEIRIREMTVLVEQMKEQLHGEL
jgi:hypothetical protein